MRPAASFAAVRWGAAAILLTLGGALAAETLLIGNKNENTVSFIDLQTGRERARTGTGQAPHEIALSPNGRQAAVVAYGGSSIDVFDVASAKLVRRIDIAPNAAPHGIVWLRDGRIVAVAERSRSLVLIDPKGGTVRSISTGHPGSHMVAVSPDQRRAYVANIGAPVVTVIDLQRGVKVGDITVGGNPEGIAITRDGRQLWVGDDSGPRLKVIDIASGRVVETLQTDPIAVRVAISPDGKTAVTSNMGAGTLSLFDVATRKPLRTVPVSGARDAFQVTIVFSADGRRLYVAETGRNQIAEVDTASWTVRRRIAAGKGGDGLGIAP